MKKLTAFLFVILPLTIAGNALADQDLKVEVQSLRQQIQALREGSIQSNDGAAQAVARLQEMQSDFESLKASLDANTHLIKSQAENLTLKMNDMDARLAALEERLKIQGRQVTAAVSTVAPEAATEGALYQTALNQINSSKFLTAIATLKTFMKKFPKSDYLSNAQYWIGECYFAMGDYEQSIKEFQVVKEKYPRSEKAPASLLKQGYAFIELDMETDAKAFLNELIRKYPQSKESKQAKDRLKRMQDLKKSEKAAPAANEVPLAPGVEVPDSEEYSDQKYR